MKYYKLLSNRNRKEVGRKPQSQDGYVGDIQQDFMPWEGKIDFDFKLPEPNLEKKAKQVSFLDVAFVHSYRFLVLDDSLLSFFKEFNLGNYQNWKINTWQNKQLIEKYNLFIINDTKQAEYINYSKSEFLIGKLGDWRDVSIRKSVIVENYIDYNNLKNNLRKTKDKKRLRHNKIVLDLSNVSEDMFRIVNAPPGGYFVSEKLKNAIEENGFTGMGGTTITLGGIDAGATRILMNPPIETDEEGTCPPGYAKDPVTDECISICNGGKVYNATTNECECPEDLTENQDGNCVMTEDDCNTSKEDLKDVFPNTSEATLEEIADAINEHGKDFGIDTKEKLQHFLAQAGHESAKFSAFEENLNYRVNRLGISYWKEYFNPHTNPIADPNKANPNDFSSNTSSIYVDHVSFANHVYNDAYRKNNIGNVNIGDGYKYRGRGVFQLTGRTNYTNFNTFYQANYDSSVNLLNNPDLVASNKEIAVISALWFYKNKVLDKITVDNNTSVKAVTEKINGGKNGLNDRKELHTKTEINIDCL